MNAVILIGNIGEDVRFTKFESGNCVANFSLATTESYKKKDTGEKVKDTTWHNIVMRNTQAEVAAKYLSKGDKISVTGKIKNREYTDKAGLKKYITEIIVREFEFITTHKSEDTTPKTMAKNESQNSKIYNENINESDPLDDDDFPF